MLAVQFVSPDIEFPKPRPIRQLGEGLDARFRRRLRFGEVEAACQQERAAITIVPRIIMILAQLAYLVFGSGTAPIGLPSGPIAETI